VKPAVIYARVSSDKQKEEHTIASQTEALRGFARQQGFSVPDEWVIEDEGYSGATLVRPGLERVRDLAAEGQIDAVLVYSPDRLSRKYAYQVLLIEEFARHNVQTVFIKAPQAATPEDQLLLQFQGMIAEYERAQILERSRRGKRHRALQGVVNVLCGAPYGYRYIRKTEHAPASYAIIDAEATVVRKVYEYYTVAGLSIGAITRLLNEQGVPTRKRCCAILRTRERPASTKRRRRSDSASRGQSVCEADSHQETAPTTSGHEGNGSRFRSRRLSPRRPLRLLRSGFRRTKTMRLVARSHPASCRGWYRAANAATVFIALRRGQVRG
jgi:DNA invertase Pin-like site-specific DNA recombinase